MRLRILILMTLAGCGGKSDTPKEAPDTLTTRQRDSAIGASGLPGAVGVQKAMTAADSAAARAARVDSAAAEIQ